MLPQLHVTCYVRDKTKRNWAYD